MGRPKKNPEEDTSPRYKNLVKQAEEERTRKATKPGVVSRHGEMVVSSFNRRKYREVIRLENGNVWRRAISEDHYKKLMAS